MDKLFSFKALIIAFILFSAHAEYSNSSSGKTKTNNTKQLTLADSIIAYVYRASVNNPGYNCSPESIGSGVPNVGITLKKYSNGQIIYLDFTDVNGKFELLAPNPNEYITIEPCFQDANCLQDTTNRCSVYNGLNVIDLLIIAGHVGKLSLNSMIGCPVLRIAADFDFSGKIDTIDIWLMQQHILANLGDNDYLFNPWRLIPNVLNYPFYVHPDPMFVSDFWSFAYPDTNEIAPYFPFDSELELLGTNYSYAGNNNWRDTVEQWEYLPPINNCGLINYGYWLVKAGDLDASAVLDFSPYCGIAVRGPTVRNILKAKQHLSQPFFKVVHSQKNDANIYGHRSMGDYSLKLKIKSQKPINAYQLGLKIDTTWFEIKSIVPKNELSQNLAKNFNSNKDQLEKGNIRTLWLRDDKIIAINENQWQEIIHLNLFLKKQIEINDDITAAVKLEPTLLESIFVSDFKKLDNSEVEIVVELVPE